MLGFALNLETMRVLSTVAICFWSVWLCAAPPILWQQSFGGSSNDLGWKICNVASGGWAIGAGSLSQSNAFYTAPNSGLKKSPNYGDNDFWLIRVAANGYKLWERSFGGSGADGLLCLTATSDGGFLLGGYTGSPADGTKTSTNDGPWRAWLIKVDADGNQVWDHCYGGGC